MKLRSTKTLGYAIYEATKGKSGTELSDTLTNTVEFMHKNQLLGKSKEILSYLEHIIDKDEKVIRVKVESATILSKKNLDELTENLKKRYKVKMIEIDNTENKNLINGIKVIVNDEIIDLTLQNRLYQLETYLIKN